MRTQDISAALDRSPVSDRQIGAVLLVQLILMIDGLDIQLLGLVAPAILAEWGLARSSFGPALSASLAGLAIGAVIGGRLGDRLGRKRVLCLAALLFGLATIAAGVARDVTNMIAIRLVSGLGFGAATPGAIALVAEWLPRRAQAKAITFLTIGTPLGGLLGALALQSLLPLLGWRGCFILCGGLTLLCAAFLVACLPESPVFLARIGRVTEAAALLTRVARLSVETEGGDSGSPGEASRVSRGRLFARRYARLNTGGWLLFFGAQFIAYGFINWAPTLLTMADFSMAQALQASFAFNALAVVAAIVAGFLTGRFGSRPVLLGGALLAIASVAMLGAILHGASGPPTPAIYWSVMLAVAGSGIFISIVVAVAYALLALGYGEEVRSSGIGAGVLVGRGGGIAIGLAGGLLLSLRDEASWPFFLALLGAGALILIGTLIVDRHMPAARGRVPIPGDDR